MSIISDINVCLGLVVDTLKQIGRGKVWLVLGVYFLVNWLVLYAHYSFTSPVFYGFVSALTTLFGSQQAAAFTHYPGQFLLLPYFFGYAKLILGLIFEGAVLGAAALLFSNSYLRVPREGARSVFSVVPRWIHLVIAWVILNGLLLAANTLVQALLRPYISGSPRRELAVELVVLPFVYTLLLSFLFFVVPSIVIFRENVLSALRRSFRTFLKNPVAVFLLSALVLVVPVVISALTANPETIVAKFKPELVYWVLLIGLVTDMAVSFLWMGSAVRHLLDEGE